MPTTPTRYRLVIFDTIDDPLTLRELVCRVTGMHPTDAVQWLARAPGLWPKALDEAEVRKLLDGLFDAQIAAEAWRADQFPELSPARTIHRAACLNEGFRVQGLRGEPTHWVPWDRIEMICAGRITAEDEYRKDPSPRWPSPVVAGIRALALMKPSPSGRRARSQRVPRDPVCEALIVRRDPRIAFRVAENQMNYAYLGDRLSQSAAENFPVFLADLLLFALKKRISRRQPAPFSRSTSPVTVNSRARRRSWNTPPIACSGAGTAATAMRGPARSTWDRFGSSRPGTETDAESDEDADG